MMDFQLPRETIDKGLESGLLRLDDGRYYELTPTGRELLVAFLLRFVDREESIRIEEAA